jgi:hypothetical protein
MKKLLYGLMFAAAFLPLQGCFWHSTTERVVVPEGGSSSTTVVTPAPATSTTVTSP